MYIFKIEYTCCLIGALNPRGISGVCFSSGDNIVQAYMKFKNDRDYTKYEHYHITGLFIEGKNGMGWITEDPSKLLHYI